LVLYIANFSKECALAKLLKIGQYVLTMSIRLLCLLTWRQHSLLCKCPVIAMAKASVHLSHPATLPYQIRRKLRSQNCHPQLREGIYFQDPQNRKSKKVTSIEGIRWERGRENWRLSTNKSPNLRNGARWGNVTIDH